MKFREAGLACFGLNRARRNKEKEIQPCEEANHQNFTCGTFSAPGSALKYCFSENPNIPANIDVGNSRIFVLYSCTASLNRCLSTAIRFSVPSSCACNCRK